MASVLVIIIGFCIAVALWVLAEALFDKARKCKANRPRPELLQPGQTFGVADIFGAPQTDHPIVRLPQGDEPDEGEVRTIAGEA